MTRKEAIERVMKNVKDRDIVVSSLGYTSRELYGVKDRDLNIYIVGGMGSCLAIALGMALNIKRRVIAIIGDGEALMSLGTFRVVEDLNPENLEIYVLNNNEYASTGGQKTVFCRFQDLAPYQTINVPIKRGKGNSPRIPFTGKQIKERFMKALGGIL